MGVVYLLLFYVVLGLLFIFKKFGGEGVGGCFVLLFLLFYFVWHLICLHVNIIAVVIVLFVIPTPRNTRIVKRANLHIFRCALKR